RAMALPRVGEERPERRLPKKKCIQYRTLHTVWHACLHLVQPPCKAERAPMRSRAGPLATCCAGSHEGEVIASSEDFRARIRLCRASSRACRVQPGGDGPLLAPA